MSGVPRAVPQPAQPGLVGIFDSGVGGLSVLREVRALLPAQALLYAADSGYAPYGERPPEAITARAVELCEFLLAQGAQALVIACNTATAAAASTLRARWPELPIVGMEPAVKPAAEATRSGVVGVLATTGTLASAQFAALLDSFGAGVRVLTQPGLGLVEAVERAALNSPATRELLRGHLAPLLAAGADVIVLGCTHYVFLREQIAALVGPEVSVVDTGAAVARQLARRLHAAGLLAPGGMPPPTRYFSSGEVVAAARVMSALLAQTVVAEALADSATLKRSRV